jgi:hypothetical protein
MLPAFADEFFINRVNVVDAPKVIVYNSYSNKEPKWWEKKEPKETKTSVQTNLYSDVPGTKELVLFGTWLISNGQKKSGSIYAAMKDVEIVEHNMTSSQYADNCIIELKENFERIFGVSWDKSEKLIDNVVSELNMIVAKIGSDVSLFPKGYPITEAVMDRLFVETWANSLVKTVEKETYSQNREAAYWDNYNLYD